MHKATTVVALLSANRLKLANMMMSQNAFVQLAAQFFDELKRNSTRLPLVEKLDLPVKVIWGEHDPYLGVAMGRERAAHFKKSSFHVLPAGHWLQCDMPKQLADLMLS